MNRLKEFYRNRMNKLQYGIAYAKINSNSELLGYVVFTYNQYVVQHPLERMQVITNPEELFITKEEQAAFIKEFVVFLRDYHEGNGAQYGNNNNHRARQENT